MLHRRTTTTTTSAAAAILSRFTTAIRRHFSRRPTTSNLPKPFSKIPWKHRSRSHSRIPESTHGLPPHHPRFAVSLRRPYRQQFPSVSVESCLRNSLLAVDFRVLVPALPQHFNVVCALAGMGFPWSKLGLLCKKEEASIFEIDPSALQRKIHGIKSGYGLNSVSVISICLAFPRVLYSEMDGLLSDLKVLLLDHDLLSYVEGNVDAVLEKDQIGLFLLSRPEIFGFDLEGRVISVSGFLEHFGLEKKELESLQQKYPHVFGRNRMANLPHVMRSMDLGEWFFEKMKRGDHSLLVTYAIRSMEDDVDKHYMDSLTRLRTKRNTFMQSRN
ncbi:UNVERIFIED_CONTAM: Transcription termination factor MTEF18, mitochondrial [Sesamum calycinum]|uniref:Transcription termination factor MTEF18, mitochondrial n=1 Tax=Sesamum calycinum TaxID=2727403 RepID=A0AAW2JKL0_9LAMI